MHKRKKEETFKYLRHDGKRTAAESCQVDCGSSLGSTTPTRKPKSVP